MLVVKQKGDNTTNPNSRKLSLMNELLAGNKWWLLLLLWLLLWEGVGG
jgi:hypothetical protein